MLCLGIDTTGAECSAAIVDSAKIHAYVSETIQRGHAERLAPMVEALLAKSGITAKELDKISVCVGPGSFTGLRVGLSLAKGMALPWNIPVVGVSGLEVWAKQADPEATKTIAACADVRRDEMFWQVWANGIANQDAQLTDKGAMIKGIPSPAEIVGSGSVGKGGFVCPAIVAWLGLPRNPRDHSAEPLYHRPPDAKLPGGRSLEVTH